jgi:hypothetical protein
MAGQAAEAGTIIPDLGLVGQVLLVKVMLAVRQTQ